MAEINTNQVGIYKDGNWYSIDNSIYIIPNSVLTLTSASTSSTISNAIGGVTGFNELRSAILEDKRLSIRGTICNSSSSSTSSSINFRVLLPENDKLIYYLVTITYQNSSFSFHKTMFTITATVTNG